MSYNRIGWTTFLLCLNFFSSTYCIIGMRQTDIFVQFNDIHLFNIIFCHLEHKMGFMGTISLIFNLFSSLDSWYRACQKEVKKKYTTNFVDFFVTRSVIGLNLNILICRLFHWRKNNLFSERQSQERMCSASWYGYAWCKSQRLQESEITYGNHQWRSQRWGRWCRLPHH